MKVSVFKFLLIFLLISNINYAQDSVSVQKKYLFSIQAGGYYKTFLDGNYIKPTPQDPFKVAPFEKHQYDRFNKIGTFGFNSGFFLSHQFNKNWGITFGLQYIIRRSVFENNQDTVIRYGFFPFIINDLRNIRNVLKYNYYNNNLELPLMLQHTVKKFTFNAGFNLSLLSYKKAIYTYLIKENTSFKDWTTSDKTVAGWEMALKIYPVIQASYEMQIKNIKFKPYVGFDYAVQNFNDLYIKTGINLPITKNN